jgi:hypothetical protein
VIRPYAASPKIRMKKAHWIWLGGRLSGATYWAVERDPDVLEQQFWQRSGVRLYKCRLIDYVAGFDRFLAEHLDELR